MLLHLFPKALFYHSLCGKIQEDGLASVSLSDLQHCSPWNLTIHTTLVLNQITIIPVCLGFSFGKIFHTKDV